MTQLMKAVKQFISNALYAALLTAGRVDTWSLHTEQQWLCWACCFHRAHFPAAELHGVLFASTPHALSRLAYDARCLQSALAALNQPWTKMGVLTGYQCKSCIQEKKTSPRQFFCLLNFFAPSRKWHLAAKVHVFRPPVKFLCKLWQLSIPCENSVYFPTVLKLKVGHSEIFETKANIVHHI